MDRADLGRRSLTLRIGSYAHRKVGAAGNFDFIVCQSENFDVGSSRPGDIRKAIHPLGPGGKRTARHHSEHDNRCDECDRDGHDTPQRPTIEHFLQAHLPDLTDGVLAGMPEHLAVERRGFLPVTQFYGGDQRIAERGKTPFEQNGEAACPQPYEQPPHDPPIQNERQHGPHHQ